MIKKKKQGNGAKVRVTFSLSSGLVAGRIAVVGDFNDWDPTTHVLKKRSNNSYSVSAILDAGKRYHFRYLSQNGGWLNDDRADGYEPSGYGSHNCLVLT